MSLFVMRSSSSLKPDLKKEELLRKFTFSRHNLQLPSPCLSVGVCGDQLKREKLFNSEESFQNKFSAPVDGENNHEGEVNVRTFAKSEDRFESLGRIIAKQEAFDHADPSDRGNKCVINAILVMIPH